MFDSTAFVKPLDSQLHSSYIEQLSFTMLKHVFPEMRSTFILSDAPDLQSKDKSVGIEITEAIAPEIAQINGEYIKLRFGKNTEQKKEKRKQLIENNGGKIDSFILSYPVTTGKDEWNIFSEALKKKIQLLPSYKAKGFKKMGLFIFFDEPPIPFNPKAAMEQFAEIQKNCMDQYDFLFLGYHNGVIAFDFFNMHHIVYTIDRDTFDELCISSRKLVEL